MVSTPGVPQALAGELGVHPKSKPWLHYSAAAGDLVEQSWALPSESGEYHTWNTFFQVV